MGAYCDMPACVQLGNNCAAMEVPAIDDNADAVLTAFETSTGVKIGTLTNSGTGAFSAAFRVNPGNVTVTSSRGATASSPVTIAY